MSKMKRMKLISLLVVVALLIGVVGAVRPTAAQDPIKIGVAVAQSGRAAGFGQDQVAGAKVAEAYLNGKGGVNGRPVQLVYQDTASDEQGAINAFLALINNDQVVGILGPTLSQQAFAADPLAVSAGVPVIAPSNTAAGIPQIGKFVFRVSAPVTQVAPNAIKAALAENPNAKKVARFFAQDDAFSKSETVVFEKTIKDLGLEEVTVQTFQLADTDFTVQISNALALSPDIVVVSGLQNDGGTLVKQLRDLGYTGLIVGGNGLNSPRMFPVCQKQCDGVIVAQAYNYQTESEINKAFVEAYNAANNTNPSQFAGQAFAGIQVFVEALSALDKESPIKDMDLATLRAKLRDALMAGKYGTPLGELSFEPTKNDKGEETGGEIVQSTFYIARIKMNEAGDNGQFVFLSAVDARPAMMEATPEATPSK